MPSYSQDLPSDSLNDFDWDKSNFSNQDITILISIIATRFIQRSGHDTSKFFQGGLALLGEYFDVEVCFIAPSDDDSILTSHNSLWLDQNYLQKKFKLCDVLKSQHLQTLLKKSPLEMLSVNRSASDTPPYQANQKILEALDLQSTLLIPLIVDQRSIFWLGLGLFSQQRKWETHQPDARYIQTLFTKLLRRTHFEYHNRNYVTRLEQLVQQQTIASHESENRFNNNCLRLFKRLRYC